MKSREISAAWGFRVRSGSATAVLLSSAASPRVEHLALVQLSDPAFPETRQPYHGGFGELESDAGKIESRLRRVRSAAADSLAQLFAACPFDAQPPRAGLVVGSLVDPSSIANPHIRAHALEGQAFRSILEELLHRYSISTSLFLERSVYQQAAAVLQVSEARLKDLLARLPHPAAPWRADEKLAALAAWLVLFEPSGASLASPPPPPPKSS